MPIVREMWFHLLQLAFFNDYNDVCNIVVEYELVYI